MKVYTRTSVVDIVSDRTSAGDVVRQIASAPGQEEPFYVVDLADIVKKHKLWKLHLPRVEPFYAVKCNDTGAVLEVLAALGTGFDCASKGEIKKVLDLGVDASRIIYANPCKTASFVKYARQNDISLMTFDNETELHKIKAIYPDARLVIRIRSDDAKARCPLGIKFGVLPEKAPALLAIAKELCLNVVGVSFHVGSGCEEAGAYSSALRNARELFDFADTLGMKFELLDIGGGFPGQKGGPLAFEQLAGVIDEGLDKFFPVGCGVRIIAEPGRYYVASAFTLCTSIIGKRILQDENAVDNSKACMYYVNDGVYGSFNCLLYDHAVAEPVPLRTPVWAAPLRCSIWGPTCDGLDRIVEECVLPAMDVGDWITFPNMGAYTVAAASTFNGFQIPTLHFIATQNTWSYLQSVLALDQEDTAAEITEPVPYMRTGLDNPNDDPAFDPLPLVDGLPLISGLFEF